MFWGVFDCVAYVAWEVIRLGGLVWLWEGSMGYWVGVKAFDGADVVAANGGDGIGCVEAGDGCSIIVGVCGDL